ncbi:long-chain acyl-CoA synthetase [Rhodobium orientis]|uniref:3-methylmercaptopropionyl-CoA ligase n=1 Tax=Rhodobium orientis TaxID=34017 RepID=A0A327JT38_9HYPH|nr:AMP-binding protein [Rhodobium orientis]MBB4305024.1 long-chain acyl-CoA synthetase [Rhodobium orientis]MBK5948769.1 AMP-dependent synthetase [Rhodobium orientis]RAI26468.1 AMP-dependent synthetase [Rhodobium orientis]
MNLAAWLGRAAKSSRDRPAILADNRALRDYGGFAERSSRLAAALTGPLGCEAGDRVAIVSKNSADYLEMLYGIWWAGLAAVPVNAKLHGAEIGWILENSGARLALASSDIAGDVDAHRPATLRELIEVGSADYAKLFAATPLPLQARAPGDLAWLFYTSGTTGRPKGAMLTHRNLAAMSFAYLSDVDPTMPGDTLLHAAPMSHGSGLYAMAHVCRTAANAVPASGGFDPDEVLRLISDRPGTSMFAAPTMIKRLLEAPREIDPATIRTIIWGGAPMHVADAIRAIDRFGPRFAQIYGQGESPMTISVLPKTDIADRDHPRWRERLASAGIANSAVEVMIADFHDTPLPTGEAGEILVRGDAVMPGYWQNPEATAAALRGGWLHTGDVGAFDADGYLTLMDRSKDMIISGGSNIYPREVEEVLLAHPGVREVSVIGRPDDDWGEVVVAYVAGKANAGELDALCLSGIARFKRPKDYVFVEALPKNNYGKILKTELRRQDAERARATNRDAS